MEVIQTVRSLIILVVNSNPKKILEALKFYLLVFVTHL